MPRPNFPKPYTPLPVEVIRRINKEQAYYDRNPERAEREQQDAEEAREEERRREAEAYEHYMKEMAREQEPKEGTP